MIQAINENSLIEATPKAIGFCPSCKQKLIAKCGEIRINHWAHKSKDCDDWGKAETEWHLGWKKEVSQNRREVVISDKEKQEKHRADVVSNCGVFEFQNSTLPIQDIRKREKFYGCMNWVINISSFKDRILFQEYISPAKIKLMKFTWEHPHRRWFFAEAQVFFDLCDGTILEILYMDKKFTCQGYGRLLSKQIFLDEWLNPGYRKNHPYFENFIRWHLSFLRNADK